MVDRGNKAWRQTVGFAMPPCPSSKIRSSKTMKELPDDYKPNFWTVICGRGRDCYDWVGNRRFRILIDLYLPKFVSAKTKMDKSITVMSIVDAIHENSGGEGGFVKRHPRTGRWCIVSDDVAREKVGQQFRCVIACQEGKMKACASYALPSMAGRVVAAKTATLAAKTATLAAKTAKTSPAPSGRSAGDEGARSPKAFTGSSLPVHHIIPKSDATAVPGDFADYNSGRILGAIASRAPILPVQQENRHKSDLSRKISASPEQADPSAVRGMTTTTSTKRSADDAIDYTKERYAAAEIILSLKHSFPDSQRDSSDSGEDSDDSTSTPTATPVPVQTSHRAPSERSILDYTQSQLAALSETAPPSSLVSSNTSAAIDPIRWLAAYEARARSNISIWQAARQAC